MLEVRDYGIGELREILGTKEKQGIDRKLKGYGFEFCSTGRGERRIYTIKSIPDPFRIYAITKLGVPPQADFTIIRNLYFYFFCVEGFSEMPYVEMEAILEADGKKISSKTISKWLKYLETFKDCYNTAVPAPHNGISVLNHSGSNRLYRTTHSCFDIENREPKLAPCLRLFKNKIEVVHIVSCFFSVII